MNVPGSNLLASALSVICPQPFDYYRYQGKTINAIGLDVHTFDPPVNMTGSIQEVDSSVYHERGLDFQSQYIEIFVLNDIDPLFRSTAGDQVQFNGRRWQVISEDGWFAMDGWDAFIAVEVVNE